MLRQAQHERKTLNHFIAITVRPELSQGERLVFGNLPKPLFNGSIL
jgi:hypothetical protein